MSTAGTERGKQMETVTKLSESVNGVSDSGTDNYVVFPLERAVMSCRKRKRATVSFPISTA